MRCALVARGKESTVACLTSHASLPVSRLVRRCLEGLGGLTALRKLDVGGNRIRCLAPVANCTRLEELWAGKNKASGRSELAAPTTGQRARALSLGGAATRGPRRVPRVRSLPCCYACCYACGAFRWCRSARAWAAWHASSASTCSPTASPSSTGSTRQPASRNSTLHGTVRS